MLRNRLTGLVTVLLALSGLMALTSAPAYAKDDGCTSSQFMKFPTPGTDVQVWITLCVSYDGDYHAYSKINWTLGGKGDTDGARAFDGFLLTVRVEQYVGGADETKATTTCDYRGMINTRSSGGEYYCDIRYAHSRAYTWSADGSVAYNIDRDGLGYKTWSLDGSPRID
ncbi:hypothetical protein [Streptomyces sp. NPDC050255]|uniref:hypothetical protein n=1 Tax=Streptomyces sp. NPDC050255 TaxID=3365606 RepID=UPI0037A71D9E